MKLSIGAPTRRTESDRLVAVVRALGEIAGEALDTAALMQRIVNAMPALTNSTAAVIELLSGGELEYSAASGKLAEHLGLRLQVEGSFSGRAVLQNSLQYCRDAEQDGRVDLVACRAVGARSMVAVPLVHRRRPVGVLKVVSPVVDSFDPLDLLSLDLAGKVLGALLVRQLMEEENARLHAERAADWEAAHQSLRDQVLMDPLTRVGNRTLFMERLAEAQQRLRMEHGAAFAVVFIDLDRFKQINDCAGHQGGDAALIEVAQRLTFAVREHDTVARLAGDEFVVLLERLVSPADAARAVAKLESTLRTPWQLAGVNISLRASIGVAPQFEGATSALDLMRQADTAMYAAKAAGGDCVRIHGSPAAPPFPALFVAAA